MDLLDRSGRLPDAGRCSACAHRRWAAPSSHSRWPLVVRAHAAPRIVETWQPGQLLATGAAAKLLAAKRCDGLPPSPPRRCRRAAERPPQRPATRGTPATHRERTRQTAGLLPGPGTRTVLRDSDDRPSGVRAPPYARGEDVRHADAPLTRLRGDTVIVAGALPRVRDAGSTRGGDWGPPDANGPGGEESRPPSPHEYDQRCNHIRIARSTAPRAAIRPDLDARARPRLDGSQRAGRAGDGFGR